METFFPVDLDRLQQLLDQENFSAKPDAQLALLDPLTGAFHQVFPTPKPGLLQPNLYPPTEPLDRSIFFYNEGNLIGWTRFGNDNQSLTLSILRREIEDRYKIFYLEQKIQDANILARIAQGINITVHFDDTLELIFTQTSRLIPNSEFRILSIDELTGQMYYVFYVSEDERYEDREKVYLMDIPNQELEVINNRRSLILDQSVIAGKLNFIGAPLNAGSKTIGALCLYHHNQNLKYTERQKELLQTIADHTAGAIIKEKLINDSIRRAQQFAKLNEVGSVLTSTLEIDKLLDKVLENVVGYMEASDGNISLIDEKSGELVVKASTSPNLSFDPSRDSEYGKYNLTVPLVVKNEVIGALELFGRKNGKLFSADDQNLLSAFASHAAIALENARLYTLTDQSLALRVEELSIMQRIDQELNAQLDLLSAEQITLRWALNYSELEYGFIGLWEDAELIIGHNITQNYEYPQLNTFIKDHPSLFAGTNIQSSRRVKQQPDSGFLFPTSEINFIVPILRKSTQIGVLYLEGRIPDFKKTDEVSSFLKRLSDHATTAISNGQLHKQLSDTNNAKSEFVSFVAHELKNPMTSIKGYSELMAAGAAGPLTETQENFLEVIRNNVNRMKTIVNDLNDMTKIEAGKMRLDFSQVKAEELVEIALHSTNKQFSEKNQNITANISSGLPLLMIDRARSEQILVNLLINANKYTEEAGQIEITVRFASQIDENMIEFCVRDNGIGISEEDRGKIFTKFFRSEDDRARKSPGTGLGLIITKNLVELQGGKIWFESELGRGTSFYFTLPSVKS
ncbi:MAG TPA: ATP-binding protein [Anaerolineales bacterium]|nr:ATP-binding protein [Anaerolineales bacterium]